MPSTDQAPMLTPLVDTLSSQSLSSQDIVHHTALLAAWAWCAQHRPELGLPAPKAHPGITQAMEAMEKALKAAGCPISMVPDFLEMNCTGRIVQELQDKVAALAWPDAETLVKELASLAEQIQGQQAHTLPLELAKLMVAQGRTTNQRITAAYPMSDLPMALAGEASARTYATASHSLLSEALVMICGVSVIPQDHESKTPCAEVVLSVPPLGAKAPSTGKAGNRRSSKSDGIGLLEAWELSTRRAIVLVSPGLLFQGTEYSLREELIRENAIDMVIQLPGQTLLDTSVPPVLMVLDHQRDKSAPITFVDAPRLIADTPRQRTKPLYQRTEFWEELARLTEKPHEGDAAKLVEKSTIEANDFDLSVNRYVMGRATQKISDLDNVRPLAEVADIIRAQVLKGEEGDDGKLFIEVGGRDIDESGRIRIQEPRKEIVVAGRARKRAEQQQLRPGDVLLIGKGSTGRVALVGEDCGDNWAAGQVFLIIRAKAHGIRSEYLYRYLTSPLVQQYLEEIVSGSGIPILKAQDIKSLPVPFARAEEQERVIDIHRQIMSEYEAIKAHQAKIKELSQQHWAL